MSITLPEEVQHRPVKSRRRPQAARKLFDPAITRQAITDSFVKLKPRTMVRNPVMFVVEVGSVLTTIFFLRDIGSSTTSENVFAGLVSLWLWFTVLFANFAEAMAEGRGKAQAATLRKTRAETVARVRQPDGTIVEVPSTHLQLGDCCVVVAGEVIPATLADHRRAGGVPRTPRDHRPVGDPRARRRRPRRGARDRGADPPRGTHRPADPR